MSEGGISINVAYVKSIPGILRIVQFVLAILILICLSPWWFHGRAFVYFTASVAVIYCLVITVVFVLNVPALLSKVPWVMLLLAFAVGFTIFYFISFIICCVYAAGAVSIVFAAIFTLLATAAHGGDAFLLFREFKTQGSANGPPPSQPQAMPKA